MDFTEIIKILTAETDRLLKNKDRVIFAVDGCCAAGKTTLAAQFMQKCGCNVIHMDDFFLRPEQRTKERLAQPGGNVDYERFYETVALPLLAGKPFAYRPYGCQTQTLREPVEVPLCRVTLVEGAYSMHPSLRAMYDLCVFLQITPKEQSRRILARNGAIMHERFLREWIPLENRYFSGLSIEKQCDFCFWTDELHEEFRKQPD